jgi:outer membrane receptor protein involved in Fe transport
MTVGRVFDSSVPTGDISLSDWWRTDLAFRYQIRRDLTLTAAVDNLFAARYEKAVGFRSRGVCVRTGIKAGF